MTLLRNKVIGCIALMTLAGCSFVIEDPRQPGVTTRQANLEVSGVDETPLETPIDKDIATEVVTPDDNGTELLATATAGDPTCSGTNSGSVPVTGIVSTNGSVDSVEITASVDGNTATNVGTLTPQDFTHDDGRYKSASYSVTVPAPNGDHVIELCFIQSGSQGREPKKVCVMISATVSCQAFCQQQGVFGNIVGNRNLCNGGGPPHIPVHVKGEFGDSAELTITGPNHYTFSATLWRAGDSCVYQYNWDTEGNGGAGTYSFHAVGENGTVYDFSAQLYCR
jgi:hypothetical protein